MSVSTYTFLLTTSNNKIFKYVIQASSVANQTEAVSAALNQFIKDELGFDRKFSVNESAWNTVVNSIASGTGLATRIKIINGLIKNKAFYIKNIYQLQSTLYPTN